MAEAKRFYVGNLVADINEDDLRSLFDRFGSVSSVDIKNKRDIDGNVTATFAFVKLDELSDNDVTNVIKQCNHLKWKKQIIRVQLAQESFMDRLQKEREGNQKQQVGKFDFKKLSWTTYSCEFDTFKRVVMLKPSFPLSTVLNSSLESNLLIL